MQNDKDAMYYLEEAPVARAIANMAIPMILAMAANIVYNIVDAFFIGKLENTAMLAAITLGLPFSTILMAIGEIFGVGGGTYISRLLGEKNIKECKRVSSVNLYLCFAAGLMFIAFVLAFMTPVLNMLGAKGESLIYTKEYVYAFTFGAPFIIANFTLGQTVRAEGAAKQFMTGMILSVIVNIILDPVFIFTFNMGVFGAAVATVIGNICAVVYYLYYLRVKSTAQSISIKDFKPSFKILSEIFKIGVSAFLLACFLIVSTLMFNNYSVIYGEHVVAALGVANRVCQIVDFIAMGLYMGVVPLIAFSYASGNKQRLWQILKHTSVYMLSLILGIGIIVFTFRAQVLRAFSIDSNVISVGKVILTALLASTLFAGFSGMFNSMFQAFGKGLASNIISVARGVALIPIIIAANAYFGLWGIIWAMTAAEIFAFLVSVFLWGISKNKIINLPLSQRAAFSN